jgi:hypothetical protein
MFENHLDRLDPNGNLDDSDAVQIYYRGAFYKNEGRTRKGSDFDGLGSKNDDIHSENIEKSL